MENKPRIPSPFYGKSFLWIILALFLLFLFLKENGPPDALKISYTDFKKNVTQGKILEITVRGNE